MSGPRRGGDAFPAPRARSVALAALCVTELVSWGTLYYTVPATLPALVEQTGWSATRIMAGLTAGLLVSAAATVPVGRLVDRHGPRWVMTGGSLLGAAALVAVAAAPGPNWFTAAWTLGGLAQAALLYPPAFTALTHWYGPARVRPLTIVSLAGGLSSTVFAPLTAELTDHLGWRPAYLVVAAVLFVVTTPLHLLCLRLPWTSAEPDDVRVLDAPAGRGPEGDGAGPNGPGHVRRVAGTGAFRLFAAALALGGLGLYGATLNLVPLLVERGVGPTAAATVLGLCGAGQLLGRLGFPTLTRRTRARTRDAAILAAGALSVAALASSPAALLPATAAAVLAGAARGALTLVQASGVADRWGTRDFGTLNALATTPSAVAIALGPAVGAALADRSGGYAGACWVLAALVAAGAVLAARSGPPGVPGASGSPRAPRPQDP